MGIEECYRKIYRDCCNWKYKFDKHEYSFNELSHFVSMKGKNYDQQKVKLFIVGRAVNGWGKYENASNEFDFATAAKRDFDKVGFDWVDGNDLGSLHNVEDGKKVYYLTKSSFWGVGRSVFNNLNNCNDFKWVENIAWSNLYKIAPPDYGNPTTKMVRKQLEGCRELLKAEIEKYNPSIILMMVGYNWWFENFKDLFVEKKIFGVNKIGKNKNEIYVEAIFYYGEIPVVVTCRPEFRNQDDFVKDVMDKIKNIG